MDHPIKIRIDIRVLKALEAEVTDVEHTIDATAPLEVLVQDRTGRVIATASIGAHPVCGYRLDQYAGAGGDRR
jgi:hypothetical protein